MKKITSTTGQVIKFYLKGSLPYMIDPNDGVIVEETDAAILVDRLGSQIEVSEAEAIEPTPTTGTNEVVVTDIVENKEEVVVPPVEVVTPPSDEVVLAPEKEIETDFTPEKDLI